MSGTSSSSSSSMKSILERELNRYHQRKSHPTKHHQHHHQNHHQKVDSEHDSEVLQQFRMKIVKETLHSYRHKQCFRNYNEFIKTCSPYIKRTELDFQSFQELQKAMPKNLKRYFTAKAFIFLRPTEAGTVPTEDFLKYMERCLAVEEYILSLMRYAISSTSSLSVQYLTSHQLSCYLVDHCLRLVDPFQHIAESFTEFYAATTALKFQFYLDERNKNMISIRHIAHSDVMLELQSLISITQFLHSDDGEDIRVIGYNIHDHPEALKKKMENNWFSPYKVTSVYQTFLNLDQDLNGLLSLDELKHFMGFHKKPIRLTDAACGRILDYLITYYSTPHELDYKGFVQLVLALDDINNHNIGGNMNSPNLHIEKGLKFFWKLIDFDHSGILTYDKIQFFYKDIEKAMKLYYHTSLPSCDIIVQEIYDLLNYHVDAKNRPEGQLNGPNWEFIRKNDQAKTMVMMLLDVETFYRYEFRESLAGAPPEEEEEEPTYNTHIPPPQEEEPEHQHTSTNNFKNNSSSLAKSKFNFTDLTFNEEDNYDDDYNFE